MATSQKDLHAALAGALSGTAGQSVEVQIAAVKAVTAGLIPTPEAKDVSWLWRALVSGLLAVMLISLTGIIWTISDGKAGTSADVLVTIFTSTLTALIGLFVTSPTRA